MPCLTPSQCLPLRSCTTLPLRQPRALRPSAPIGLTPWSRPDHGPTPNRHLLTRHYPRLTRSHYPPIPGPFSQSKYAKMRRSRWCALLLNARRHRYRKPSAVPDDPPLVPTLNPPPPSPSPWLSLSPPLFSQMMDFPWPPRPSPPDSRYIPCSTRPTGTVSFIVHHLWQWGFCMECTHRTMRGPSASRAITRGNTECVRRHAPATTTHSGIY